MSKLLELTDRGLYCPPGDFYIDPWQPVPRAVITHAHGDHARWGSEHYLTAIAGVDRSIGPIMLHGAVERLVHAYQRSGVNLPDAPRVTTELAKQHQGRALIIAPPSADGTPWLRKFGDISTAIASGWMQIRG